MHGTATAQEVILPRRRPADVGVPASSVLALLDGLDAEGIELHSLMVVRHGQVAAEGWWSPYGPERPHLLYSLSKSFTSAAVGFAIAEGRFRLDDTVVSLLPGHVPDDLDPAVATLTVHHVLSMSTGHNADTLEQAFTLEPDDLVKGFLGVPPQEPVGSRHVYNNTCTYVLAMLVQELTGEYLLDYLRPRLLSPLGIGPAHWDNDAHGNAVGFSGLHLATEAVAAFGQLLLQCGHWQGRQVLPEGWVELATRKHIPNDLDPATNVDWAQGYGYQFWMARHGFRGDGAYSQLCVVLPDEDLVVVTTGCSEKLQGVLDNIWTHLLPALDTFASAEDESADELDTRLAALALPVVEGALVGPADEMSFDVQEGGEQAPLAPGTIVEVRAAGVEGWELTIVTGDSRLTLACGHTSWAESALGTAAGPSRGPRGTEPREPTPVVVRGGWTTADTFEGDIVLIETPHRIRFSCKGARAEATWNAVPLSGARLEAHLP
ncbi:MAG: serine hydrolase domain-containing protein [Lapillicoccus sp.]